ncbi:MAG: NAD-dependent DNA ligase LigA, partial [Spirochaetales bacterium]|nr:NAD-dependent DNA ligase LigA [Spirochaetales bacterium]
LVGNDVTANVKTIGAVPLGLCEPVDVTVRGEIFLPREEFRRINDSLEIPYVNPRNLASGTLRRVKSSDVAGIPLDIFVYEGFFQEPLESHHHILKRLWHLGFKINPTTTFFTPSELPCEGGESPFTVRPLRDLESFLREETDRRSSLSYDIDGIVLKVDDLPVREELGYTGHHPRWAVAYKFEAPLAETRLLEIDLQVGRTGRITPVARVEPVSVGGATIRNVTLHNADYVSLLEAAPGDTVTISRRGDVIPAVEKVVEKGPQAWWKMPDRCPSCSGPLEKSGAHHFCTNRACPAQVRGRILFFVDRLQMDIDGLGPETVDVLLKEGLVRDIEDLYTCDYSKLETIPGFGEKKVRLIRQGIENSKKKPFKTVLKSLGIPDLGAQAAELLISAGRRTMDALLEISDRKDTAVLEAIDGIGEKTALKIIEELGNPVLRRQIEALRKAGLSFEAAPEDSEVVSDIFAGQTWCVTGSFEFFKPRSLAMEEVARRGGNTTAQVSGQTTHLLAGEGAGSKLTKARELGITIVSEKEFLGMLKGEES